MGEKSSKPKVHPWKIAGLAYMLISLALSAGWFIVSLPRSALAVAFVWIGLIGGVCLLIEFKLRTPSGAQVSRSRQVLRTILIGSFVLIGLLGLLVLWRMVEIGRGMQGLEGIRDR